MSTASQQKRALKRPKDAFDTGAEIGSSTVQRTLAAIRSDALRVGAPPSELELLEAGLLAAMVGVARALLTTRTKSPRILDRAFKVVTSARAVTHEATGILGPNGEEIVKEKGAS